MIAEIEDSVDANGILIDQNTAYKKILNSRISLQLDEMVVSVQVKGV